MVFLKKYYNVKANSILESVIALSIISVCLYIAVVVFAAVFTPKTSAAFYNSQNKVNELFFTSQLKKDSLFYESEDNNLLMEEENITDNLKKLTIRFKDSSQIQFEKSFYIQSND